MRMLRLWSEIKKISQSYRCFYAFDWSKTGIKTKHVESLWRLCPDRSSNLRSSTKRMKACFAPSMRDMLFYFIPFNQSCITFSSRLHEYSKFKSILYNSCGIFDLWITKNKLISSNYFWYYPKLGLYPSYCCYNRVVRQWSKVLSTDV